MELDRLAIVVWAHPREAISTLVIFSVHRRTRRR
jgi:hypothetical protein